MINRGPVDVVVLAAAEPNFEGKVFAELKRQTANGVIRVLDAMVLLKDEKGDPWQINLEDLPQEQKDAVGFIAAGTHGLFDSEDAYTLFDGMVPGSAVVAFDIEHIWAIDLVNALHGAGVEMALGFRVPAVVVDEAFASLPVKN